MMACIGGDVYAVKHQVTQCKCDPMCKANDGTTPLHSACYNSGNLKVIFFY